MALFLEKNWDEKGSDAREATHRRASAFSVAYRRTTPVIHSDCIRATLVRSVVRMRATLVRGVVRMRATLVRVVIMRGTTLVSGVVWGRATHVRGVCGRATHVRGVCSRTTLVRLESVVERR